jgi:NAD-dependent dihydropyrimidine dehydrogenase PreA subunit/uncharacterized membrane protein YgcG
MKRATLNFSVDAAIALAFLITAVSGILFLLPAGVIRSLGLGMPGMLGVSFATWHWLHDWSGVVATAGVLVHAALHYRWIVTMTRRTFGARRHPTGSAAAARPSALASARPAAAVGAVAAPAARQDGATTGVAWRDTDQPRRTPPRERLVTRRRFVVGAAGVGLAALGGGVVLRLGVWAADALDGSSGTQAAAATRKTSSGGISSSSGSSSGSSASSAGATKSGATSSGGASAAVLVSVDASSCVGCGRCLNTCPRGVFSWDSSGSRATAGNAANCIGCRRCLQVCPASAITVNA